MPRIYIGNVFEGIIDYLRDAWGGFFDVIRSMIEIFIDGLDVVLGLAPFWLLAIIIAVIAFFRAGKGLAIFSLIGLLFIACLDLWPETIATLSLIFAATLLALVIGIPLGILAAKFNILDKIIRPILDFMQTMPAFVYLIPSVLFF